MAQDFPERPIPSAKLPKFLIKGGPGTGGPLLTVSTAALGGVHREALCWPK